MTVKATPMRVQYIIGLDLGQGGADYSAVCVVKQARPELPPDMRLNPPRPRVGKATYTVNHLYRYPLKTRSPEVVEDLVRLKASKPLNGNATVVIDRTGAGQPVFDQFLAAGLGPIGVWVHGGAKEKRDADGWNVPKRNLVGVMQVLSENQRLKIVPTLPHAPLLIEEMKSFQAKISVTSHDTYGATPDDWRTSPNDDLVLAVAFACWWGERGERAPLPRVQVRILRGAQRRIRG